MIVNPGFRACLEEASERLRERIRAELGKLLPGTRFILPSLKEKPEHIRPRLYRLIKAMITLEAEQWEPMLLALHYLYGEALRETDLSLNPKTGLTSARKP